MGIIDYFAFENRSRYLITPKTDSFFTDPINVITEAIDSVLNPPKINIWEFQDCYIELWIEKDALMRLFMQIADEYQLRLYPSRGYSSLTKIQEAKERFLKEINEGKHCIILYFGDLDPSGWNIYEDIKKKFSDLPIEIKRVAVNPDQTNDLIPMPLKQKDTRVKSFLQKVGLNECYELDALPPEYILSLARKSIEKYIQWQIIPDTLEWLHKYQSLSDEIKDFLHKLNEKLSIS